MQGGARQPDQPHQARRRRGQAEAAPGSRWVDGAPLVPGAGGGAPLRGRAVSHQPRVAPPQLTRNAPPQLTRAFAPPQLTRHLPPRPDRAFLRTGTASCALRHTKRRGCSRSTSEPRELSRHRHRCARSRTSDPPTHPRHDALESCLHGWVQLVFIVQYYNICCYAA
jgi:hypothetical protein